MSARSNWFTMLLSPLLFSYLLSGLLLKVGYWYFQILLYNSLFLTLILSIFVSHFLMIYYQIHECIWTFIIVIHSYFIEPLINMQWLLCLLHTFLIKRFFPSDVSIVILIPFWLLLKQNIFSIPLSTYLFLDLMEVPVNSTELGHLFLIFFCQFLSFNWMV